MKLINDRYKMKMFFNDGGKTVHKNFAFLAVMA